MKKVYRDKVYLITEKHKKCFELCRKNNVGGPAIVFHRYDEKDITRIQRAKQEGGCIIIDAAGKLIKNIRV